MNKFIYILLFLISFQGNAQSFANKKYYLVDSFVIENIPETDLVLVDSCLKVYHSTHNDIDKINALNDICENMMHDDWIKYQYYQHKLIEKALSKKPSAKDKKKLLKSFSDALVNIAYVHLMKGENSIAIEYYEKAKPISEKLNDKSNLATYYLSMGFIYNNKGDIAKALDYYDKGLKISEEIEDVNGVANALQNIAGIYFSQGEIDKSIEFCKQSLKVYQSLNNRYGEAYALNSLGAYYTKKGDTASAIDYYKRSITIRIEIGDKHGLSDSYNNIGNFYHSQNNVDKALEYFYKGLKIQEELGYHEVTKTLFNIGILEFSQGNYEKAKKIAKLCLEKAKEIGFPREIKNGAKLLSDIHEVQNNGMPALEMYKLYISMRDSILNEESQKATLNQLAQFKYEKKKAVDDAENEKLFAVANEEKEKQQVITTASIVGLFLVILFLLFVFNRLRITRKQKAVIENQKEIVEEAHQEIKDSITYAKRIQSAILPPNSLVKENLKESFILYKPKDVVAGDFYWMEHKDDKVLFAAADCTGHGVPGAMVSVVCNNALNRSVREHGLTDPGEILTKTRDIVIQEFEKSEEDVKDGMDIALCSLEGNKLQYAGAHNPLWIIRKGELIETKANKQPIGQFDNPEPYTTHSFDLEPGDSIYIFSDGYVDQFGGEKGKKYKAKAFRELLLSIQDKSMEEQKIIIDDVFEAWKGTLEQIDDVCVIGVSV